MEAELAARFSTRGARHSIPEHSETYICHEFRHSDQTIKSETVGTDPRLKTERLGGCDIQKENAVTRWL